jgi:acetolactate synthase-1/2/3 large subunit
MISADYIIEFLTKKGVKNAFGYPGSLAGFTMESLRNSNLKNHTLPDEQQCGFAAIGQTQVSRIPSLVWTTSGPGAANLLNPIASAYFDSVPVFFLTHNTNTKESKTAGQTIRQVGNQELNIVECVKGITKFAYRVTSADEIPELLEQAWDIMISGRPGPVLLDLPIDVSRSIISSPDGLPASVAWQSLYGEPDPEIAASASLPRNDEKLDLTKLIQGHNIDTILLGGGIYIAGVEQETIDWVKQQDVTVLKTMMSKDLPIDGELIGPWGTDLGNKQLENAKSILSLGSRLSNRQLAKIGGKLAPGTKLVRLDIDESEFERQVADNEIDIVADLRSVIPSPDGLLASETKQSKLEGDRAGYKRIITIDVGVNMWDAYNKITPAIGDRILFDGGNGCMGNALAKAIGAWTAEPDAEIIAIVGDGGLQMSLADLQYIGENKLPIIVLLFNNSKLGLITKFQDNNFDSNYFATTKDSGYCSPKSFGKLAEAFGIEYRVASYNDEYNSLLNDVSKTCPKKPFIVEILYAKDCM